MPFLSVFMAEKTGADKPAEGAEKNAAPFGRSPLRLFISLSLNCVRAISRNIFQNSYKEVK